MEQRTSVIVMRNVEQAKQIAICHVESLGFYGVDVMIDDDSPKEFDAGWVFFYRPARFIETSDIQHSLVGNSPIFVPRNDLPPICISYHRPLEESIAAFNACGDPNGIQIAQVVLSNWKPGASAVSAIQAIRKHSTLGLAAAKHAVEKCLEKHECIVATHSVFDAQKLVQELLAVKFVAEIKYRV
jgi:hypothetical protein